MTTPSEFSGRFLSFRQVVKEEAVGLKDPYYAWEKLHEFYEQLNEADRKLAQRSLAEWVVSDDENLRFDGLEMINHYGVITAAPALRTLRERLRGSKATSAPFELEKVERFLNNLLGTQRPPPSRPS